MKQLITTLFGITLLFITTTSFAQQVYVIKKGVPVATTNIAYDKMIDAAVSKDMNYFKKLISNYYVIVLPKDLEVYLVKASWTGGKTVVRIKGEDTKLWVSSQNVKKK